MLFNPLNAELNLICHLLALLGAHHILHVSRIRVKYKKCWRYIEILIFYVVVSLWKSLRTTDVCDVWFSNKRKFVSNSPSPAHMLNSNYFILPVYKYIYIYTYVGGLNVPYVSYIPIYTYIWIYNVWLISIRHIPHLQNNKESLEKQIQTMVPSWWQFCSAIVTATDWHRAMKL